jgi:hypothetical protein
MESKRLETYDKIDLSYRTGTFNIVNAKSFCVYQLETKSVGRSFAAANPGLSDMFTLRSEVESGLFGVLYSRHKTLHPDKLAVRAT